MKYIFLIFVLAVVTAYYFRPSPEVSVHRAQSKRRVTRKRQTLERSPSSVPQTEPPQEEELKGLRAYQARLNKLDLCAAGGCPYVKSDLRSYDFELGQDLKNTLAEMSEWARAERVEDAQISEIARKYLASHDGHVQEGALDLLATQPTSPENMHAVLDYVISGYDPELIEQGMLELGRYGDRRESAKIVESLGQAILSGAPFVAREISTRIEPFINSDTFSYFHDLAQTLPERSLYRENLEKNLARYASAQKSG